MAVGLAIALSLTACSGDADDDNRGPELEDQSGPETATDPTTTTVAQTITTADTSIFFTPLVIDKGDVIVTFDRWFFILQDPDSRVEVRTPGGDLIAEGTVAGVGSIMRETPDNSFELLGPSGSVVAVVTQQDLNDAVAAAREAAGE